MSNDAYLKIEIKNSNPVELLDLTRSLVALSNQFQIFVKESNRITPNRDVALYIHEIKTGSIIVQLQELFTQVILPFTDNTNTILDFALYLKSGFDAILSKKPSNNNPVSIDKYKDLSAIVDPIAKDNAAQLNVSTVIKGNLILHVNINSIDSNALQNIAKNGLRSLKAPITDSEGILKRQTLTFYQARNDPKSKKGTIGLIEELSDKKLNISFSTDELQNEILHGEANPFQAAFVVDISIENINGKPAIYKIHKYHEYFDLTEQPD